MKLLSFIFFGALAGTAFSQSQDLSNQPPLPDGPLLRKAPDFSSWTIISQKSGSDSGGPSGNEKSSENPKFAKQVMVTKTGQTILEKTVRQGMTKEIWYFDGMEMAVDKDGGVQIAPNPGSTDIFTADYRKDDFAGLGWISNQNYAGVQKLSGKDCLVFQGKISPLSTAELWAFNYQIEADRATAAAKKESYTAPAAPEIDATAWIDLSSRLPVAARFGKETRIYTFGVAPVSPLALPPAMRAAYTDYSVKLQKLVKKPRKR